MTSHRMFHRLVISFAAVLNDPNSAPAGDPAGGPPAEDPPAGDPPAPKFSPEAQAAIDAEVQRQFSAVAGKKVSEAQAKWEADLKTYAEAENKTAEDKAKDAADAADKRATDAISKANGRLVNAAATLAAATAGANPARVPALLKLADLAAIEVDDEGTVDEAALTAALAKVLADYPEFKSAAGAAKAGATGADMAGGAGSTKVWTKAEIAALSEDDFDKHEAEILAQMRAGTVK